MKKRKIIFTCIIFFVSVLFIEAGTLKGHVKYIGKPPKKKRLRMDADPVCGAAHTGRVYNENFKMAEDGSMEEALIYIKDVSYSGGIPSEPTISQAISKFITSPP